LILAALLAGLAQSVFAQASPLHVRIDERVTQAHVGPLAQPLGMGSLLGESTST